MFHPRAPCIKYIPRRWTLSWIQVAHARLQTNMQIMTPRSDSLSYVRVLANDCTFKLSVLQATGRCSTINYYLTRSVFSL